MLVVVGLIVYGAFGPTGCVDALRDLVGPGEPPRDILTDAVEADELSEPDRGSNDDEGVDAAQCSTDLDCRHLDDCCTRGYCYQGTCQVSWLPDCCTVEGPCSVTSIHYSGVCDVPCGEGSCHKGLVLDDAPGCESTSLYEFDPDTAPLSDLVLVDASPGDTVAWHVTNRRGLGGGRSLYAGDVNCATYHTGPLDGACEPLNPALASAVELQLQTAIFGLPAQRPAVLRLWLWADVEAAAPGKSSFDGLEVGVRRVDAAYTRTVWTSRDAELPKAKWVPVLIDLVNDAGVDVSIWLTFSTGDGVDNDHEGIYVGRIEVLAPCPSDRACAGPSNACDTSVLVPIEGLSDALCVEALDPPGQACQPCATSGDCDLVDSCDIATCPSGRCVIERDETPQCCAEFDVWPSDGSFETAGVTPATGWQAEPVSPAGGASWHVTSMRAYSGNLSLRFGVPQAPLLAPVGEPAAQMLWSPTMRVPDQLAALEFQLWLSTEWDLFPNTSNPAGVDRLSIWLRRSGSELPPVEIWSGDVIGGTTQGAWTAVAVALDSFLGLDVGVGFRFETGDAAANDYEGACVDSIRLVRRCPAPSEALGGVGVTP